jgi:Flp pilus assembly protein TadG
MRGAFGCWLKATGPGLERSAHVAIEFAAIIPALILLIVFLVEGSVQLLTASVLQYGLRDATRFGVTGRAYPQSMSASPPASREAAITQIMATSGIGLINPSYLTVTLTSYANFASVGLASNATSGAGGPGAIVQYQVSYFQPWLFSWPAYPPAVVTGLAGWQYKLTTVVQNEPFPAN